MSEKNQIEASKFLSNLEYDEVFNILFEIISMNADFFRRGMEKIGIKAKRIEQETPASTGE